MSEVSCRAWSYFKIAADRGYVSLDELLEGSALDRDVLERPTQRVPWNDWALLCDRFSDLVGGVRETERTAAELTLASEMGGPLKTVAAAIASPSAYLRFAINVVAPMLFRHAEWSCTELPNGRLDITFHIPEPYLPSRGWVAMARGGIPSVPGFLGMPHALVTGTLTPRGGTMILTPPPSATLLERLRRWFMVTRGAAAIADELAFQQRALLETERSLSESEDALRTMVSALPDLLLTLDGDLRIVDVHVGHAAEALAQVRQARGQLLFDVIDPQDRVDAAAIASGKERLERVLRDRAPDQYEYRRRVDDGELIVDVRLVPYQNDGLLLLARDVSKERSLERQVAVAERMASMGQLAAGVAHEINNPLTYLSGNLEHLRGQLPALLDPVDGNVADEVLGVLDECIEGAGRVSGVVADLGRFSRIDTSLRVPIDVEQAIQSAVALTALDLKHRATTTTDIHGPLPTLVGDPGRLSQVIVNLLINAAHAVDGAPVAEVGLTARAEDGEDGQLLRISVTDSGPGVPAAVLPRIFDPFFTTKPQGKGTGLGLSISRTTIEGMGGRLVAVNRPEGGARFDIILPVATNGFASPVEPAVGASVDGLRVLIIDDEPAVGRAVGRLLVGAQATVVHDAAEAQRHIDDEASDHDVILCDLMMPGVTGMQWYDALPAAHPARERVLFMTGGAVTQEAVAFLARPDVRHLSKPFSSDELRQRVAQVAAARG